MPRSTKASRLKLKRNTGLKRRSQCLARYRRGRGTERIPLLRTPVCVSDIDACGPPPLRVWMAREVTYT